MTDLQILDTYGYTMLSSEVGISYTLMNAILKNLAHLDYNYLWFPLDRISVNG